MNINKIQNITNSNQCGKLDMKKDTSASNKDTKASQSGIRVDISEQGRSLVESDINENELKKSYEEQVAASNDEAEAFADTAKLLEVARRIANGDKVPAKDEKKLMEYNFKLYQIAKQMALVNHHKYHKKYKSLYPDENEDKKADEESDESDNDSNIENNTAAEDEESTNNEDVSDDKDE